MVTGTKTASRTWRVAAAMFVAAVGLAMPQPSQAIPVLPGQALEIGFTLSGVPSVVAGQVDTLTFRLGPGTTQTDLIGITVELFDGNTLLGTNAGLAMADIAAFVESGSAWTLNATTVSPDLSTVRDGTIDGRIRVTPIFSSPAGVLDAEFFPFTGLQIGYGTAAATLLPPSTNHLVVGAPAIVPEPSAAAALLLAGFLAAFRRR